MKIMRSLSLISLTVLAACSGSTVKDTLGIGRSAPDEFRVVSRPPLSVPPQFNLRPPGTTDLAPGDMPASQQAEKAVLGDDNSNTFSLTPEGVPENNINKGVSANTSAESQLLMNAGADRADPSVRNTLTQEKLTIQEQQEEAAWWEVWSTKPEKKDPLVDAKKEAERIKKNEEEGKPVDEGETPQVKQRDRGILGRILGD